MCLGTQFRRIVALTVPLIAACTAGLLGPAAVRAADYQIVASGPLFSTDIASETFDGTTSGTLPPLLDGTRLAGGSFRATYRFSSVTPASGNEASYDLSPSSGVTFEMLDASGAVVYASDQSSQPFAFVENNYGGAPFTVDQVFLGATLDIISGGVVIPAARYGPTDYITGADINVFGYVSPGVEYVGDLGIPTDAATYLGFPGKNFEVLLDFEDGDYNNRVGPFQSSYAAVSYDITSLAITPVPEPTAAFVVALGALVVPGPRRGR